MYYLKKDEVAEFLEGELPFLALMRPELSSFSCHLILFNDDSC